MACSAAPDDFPPRQFPALFVLRALLIASLRETRYADELMPFEDAERFLCPCGSLSELALLQFS
jgi:hypothetical protein